MSNDFLYTSNGKPYGLDQEILHIPGRPSPIENTTLIIPGAVCKRWMESSGKICPFCAFPPLALSITKGKTFATSTFWEMCQGAFEIATDRMTIFNGGSFFPAEEIPLDFQRMVYQEYRDNDRIDLLAVETRPEYFDDVIALQIRENIGSKDFMIMIGLESTDSMVRNKHLKKAMRWDRFEKALTVAKRYGFRVFVYVMHGAPGLSEKEAMNDVLQSLELLTSLGIDEIALSTTFVSPETDLLKMYEEGKFKPPNLWSIVHILQLAEENNWPLRFGGFEETPSPIATADSCPECRDDLYKAIACHRKSGILGSLPSCDCRTKWEADIFC